MNDDSSAPRLAFVQIKERLADIDARLAEALSYSDSQIDLSPLREDLRGAASASTVLRLAIAGVQNAGKTSIIRALTGQELVVGADVTTNTIQEVPYKDQLLLIDMPGTLSGLPEHDSLAQKAIVDSDLMLFVLSNELFNVRSLPYFEQAMSQFEKGDQTLLVVNQFDRVNRYGRTDEDAIFLISEQLSERIAPRDISRFGPIFVSARDYLDSFGESDPVFRDELVRDSRISDLIKAIDRCCYERGITGKLARLFQVRLDVANRAMDLAAGDDEEQKLLQELLRRKLDCYTIVQNDFRQEVRNLSSSFRHGLAELAEPVVALIERKATGSEVSAAWEEADTEAQRIAADGASQLKDAMEKALERLQRDLDQLDQTPVAQAVADFLKHAKPASASGLEFEGERRTLADTLLAQLDLKDILNKGGEHITEHSKEIGEFIVELVSKFKKFKPWGKTKLGKAIEKWLGRGGKCIGPLAVLFECYMNYREEEHAERVERERLSFKAEVRKALTSIALELCRALETCANEFNKKVFQDAIDDMRRDRGTAASQASNRKDLIRRLAALDGEIRDGLELVCALIPVNGSGTDADFSPQA